MSEHANNLRSIAQNDYMIDQHFLPDGEALNKAADRLEELEAIVAQMRIERTNALDEMTRLDQELGFQ